MTEQYGTEPLKVRTFGSCVIEYKGETISDQKQRSRQVWLLLQYMIVNRFNEITAEELEKVLWRDNASDDLSGALKNLVYRLRNMLTAVGRTPEREYIVSRHGNYAWNNDIPCVVDSEEMVELYRSANLYDTSRQEALEYYMRAIEYYRGDFLNNNAYEEWVVPMSAYYRNLFLDCVYKAVEILMEVGRYSEAERVCSRALTLTPLEEKLHIMKMQALAAAGQYKSALDYYEEITSRHYKKLRLKPSAEFQGVYAEIAQQFQTARTDISAVKEYLKEPQDQAGGSFYCDYEVFKNIYNLQARSMERTGQAVLVGLLTLSERGKDEVSPQVRERAMGLLHKALAGSLRRGDVYARFSATQFVLLLPTLTFANSDNVFRRIESNFTAACDLSEVALDAKFMPIDPVL